ncbi:SPOR domain-containing protein [Arthrobacter sp. TPD3018]|nr:SPOR domain-containing protein [Sphingomonas sp. TPD3009]PVE58331.1 SPOR domain-containing protein [Arthrobacter sp. TPD3018]PVE87913.1 SPOR domain-containing protein [Sphingomonas melonis]
MRVIVPALLASAALLLASVPAASPAQEVVQPLPGTTDADRLAEQMRALAANPRDLNALVAAADLSLSLGDLSGAASLYARAEKVSPNDPRIKAGEGAILVRSERPGEALRYFSQAEAAGYDVRRYAGDRGLAYDLIGQSERAQRDYRLALQAGANDEVIQRYALSLGIVGQRDAALQLLDPLVRKQDRSAWRTRAFVLAMTGDQPGAEKIVTTMLPQGMAQGLLPFFQRLPALSPADRAFAVHFGEVHASPERIADARLAPVLPQLAPERPPVALAAVQTPTRPTGRDTRRGRATRETKQPTVALAANLPSAATPAGAPSYQAVTAALARVQPVPAAANPAPVAQASTTAMVQPLPSRASTAPVATPTPTTASAANVAIASAITRPVVTPAPATANPVVATATPQQPVVTAAAAAPTPVTANPAIATATPTRPAAVSTTVASTPATAVVQPLPATRPAEVASATPIVSVPPAKPDGDSVLARIVASLSIPASELGVTEPVRAAPAPATADDTAARVLAEAKAKEERDAAAEKALALKAAADKRAADRKALADKKALAAKKLADEKAAVAKKEAAEKKLAEAKEAAEEKKLARANPSRIWVQVAGGANEDDLPKAWAAAKAKSPALAGKSGWKTPLRATNRVLTGPFKTDAEARSFVNQLTKQGIGAFTFTSDAGQVVERLSAK